MTDTVTPLPRWDTDSIFPGLGSREWAAANEALGAGVERLTALYDDRDVRGGEPRTPTDEDLATLRELLGATNELLEQARLVRAYAHALVSTDAGDAAAAAAEARIEADMAGLTALAARRSAWIARLGADALAAADPVAAEHAHLLRRSEEEANHLMSEGEERLHAELQVTGGLAWARLAGELTSTLSGRLDGEDVPVTLLRGHATSPDAALRERAYHAEGAAWETIAAPVAACLNAIKGEAVTVNRRRGWPDDLAPALWRNAIERRVLDAMQEAVVDSLPDFRRWMRSKAALLDRSGALPWWDLAAPVPGEATLSWEEAGAAVQEAFLRFSPALRNLATRAMEERWVDPEPRSGKRGGAYCMSVRGTESRILMNFDGSFDSVQTLAHELGHAYHNTNLAARPALLRATPMALAETASIFCETVMVQSGLAGAGPEQRLALLNVDIGGANQVVVDIHSRFLFERAVFERRARGPLAPDELAGLMLEAQATTYGDGVDAATYHPWMWVLKPHYYFPDAHFYNWPYTFGLLFGLGLYARFEQDPDRFRADYDDLLASTGTGAAAELAARFDIDISDAAFWASSIDVLRRRIDDFAALVGSRRGGS